MELGVRGPEDVVVSVEIVKQGGDSVYVRGEAAARDQRWRIALCERLSIPFATETVDVPAHAKANGQSLEQAARVLRYDFLERARLSFRNNFV